MVKWPDVPEVYGWLQLDRRGRWLIKSRPTRDSSGEIRFERIANAAVTEFINRNYQADANGRWFFQNGPQRVFVMLHYTPLVYRIVGSGTGLATHTGLPIGRVSGAWLDERGALLLKGEQEVGVLSDRDLGEAVTLIRDEQGQTPDEDALAKFIDGGVGGLYLHWESGRVSLERIDSSAVAERFGFVADPRPPAGQPDC
jgi:hypothetical protein